MDLSQVLQWNLMLFILILFRWAGMIMLAPVFGARGVPAMVKIVVAGSLSMVIYPMIAATKPAIPTELLPYIAVVVKETLVGLVIGFVISAMTSIFEGAGQLIDLQMGFAMGSSLDPVYGVPSPLIGNFQSLLATMLLLSTNAHQYLLAAMIKSYAYIPVNPASIPASYLYYAQLIGNIFSLSLQIAIPVFGALLVSDIGVGLLSRVVPQLNIFSVVFPVKIIFGFILLIIALPFFGESVTHLFNLDLSWILQLYQGWKQ